MNRKQFFRRFIVGAAAIVVAPKIISKVVKSETSVERGTRMHEEMEKCLNSNEYFYKNYVTVNGKRVYLTRNIDKYYFHMSDVGIWAGSDDINTAPFIITRNGVMKVIKKI